MKTQQQIDDHHERECALADARLGVAEAFAWCLSIVTSIAAHLKWGSWALAIILGAFLYVVSTRPYKKASDKAWASYNSRQTVCDDF